MTDLASLVRHQVIILKVGQRNMPLHLAFISQIAFQNQEADEGLFFSLDVLRARCKRNN